jgi:diguanylate cyclase (GGDEF)-like protein
MAHSDPLTGALNRRGLYERLPGELADLKRKQRPIAMVLCDLDHFKQINDRHGHDVGDAVLVHFAALINSLKRPRDLCVRLGGEEFALILPEAGAEQAMGVARRLHEYLSRARHDGLPAYTSSFGVASLELEQLDTGNRQALTEEWFRRADMAVYRAKTAGRNRIEAG